MDASSNDWPLHQLWPPDGDSRRIDMDIVLFHGLQLTANDIHHAWTSTWTQRDDGNVCWPQKWLPYDLGEAVRIISVSYDAHVRTSPHNHVSEIADNLFQNFVDRRYKWQHPIVLIGHSFGGLVLKSLLVKLKESTNGSPGNALSEVTSRRAKMFSKNVRGIAFYAVPHIGSTNISTYVNKLLRCKKRHHGEIMANIEPNRRDMSKLSVDFEQIVIENKINIRAFCEGKRMERLGILVAFASAQQLARKYCYTVEDANHMEVCKPPRKSHPSYQLLLDLIIICGKVSREFEQAQQDVHELRQSTFGLDKYVEEIETLVTSAGSDVTPKYLGVWGMGGVGKSVLLKTLYARAQVNNHFQGVKFIWRTVGKSPDITSIYRFLSQQLGLEPELDLNALDYKDRLEEVFKQERVFLVLDDVWEKQTTQSLPLAKGNESVTLLSTRNEALLEIASPEICKVHMRPLLDDDSWSLFCVHAFGRASSVPDELKKDAQSMAQQCAGLPLGLKVIGAGMRGEKRPKQWELQLKKLTESRMHDGPGEELYEFLKVGYDLLSDRLKQCFHYFAAFPEKSDIVLEEILFHWSGEGLVPEYDGDDAREEVISLLKQLWQRSFIESNGTFDSDQSYLLHFKLHDVMRDLALYVLKKDCGTLHSQQRFLYRAGQNLGKIPQELKRISETPESKCTTISEALRLSLDTNKFETLPEFYAPKLEFLLLGGNPMVSIPATFSSYFPKLRVLNLRKGQFHTLPDELGDLINLVCLDLSNCHELKILPETVRKLHKLEFLILDDCWALEYLPSGIVQLSSLQVLHTAYCECLKWARSSSSRTARAGFDDLHPTIGASLEDICQLPLLTELTICADAEWQMMLTLAMLPPIKLPHNISSLTSLRILQVHLEIETFPADMARRCIHLQELELISSLLKFLPRSFTRCGAFPALIKLNLCCSLVKFPEVDEGALPKLEILDLNRCESLEGVPPSLVHLKSLRSVIMVNCEWYVNEMTSRWEEREIIQLTSTSFDMRNTRRYTFNLHNIEDICMFLKWKSANLQRRTADRERNEENIC